MGKWKETGEVRKGESRDEPWTQPCSLELTVGLDPVAAGIRLWLALSSAGRAKRFSEHSFKSEHYMLQLNPGTWAGMKHRGAATVVWQTAFQTEKQSHRAWPPSLNVPEFISPHPFLGGGADYSRT